MSLETYVVEGGIGKCVAFTALVPSLAEKAGEGIQVTTPYYQCFSGNPEVKMVFDESSIFLDDGRITISDNIHYSEPYKSNFVKGDQHIIEAYCNLHGVAYSPTMRPKIYTELLKSEAKKWLKHNNIDGKFMLVQFSGGQTPIGWNPNTPYTSSNPIRNYPPYFAQAIINMLNEKYPKVTIIDVTLPNEPGYPGTIKCPEHWTLVHELMKKSEGFIGIDSCLNHFSASTGVSGVVLWGNTRWTQFGYMHNQNLSFSMSKPNDYIKTDINDPRNLLVGPEVVVEIFSKNIMDNKAPVNVECANNGS